jgi:GT2 family glycosyltransferase
MVGLFDENVFLYGEELILGEKFFKHNLEVYYLNYIQVRHLHAKTLNLFYDETKKIKTLFESNIYYLENYRNDIHNILKYLIKIGFCLYINIYRPLLNFIKIKCGISITAFSGEHSISEKTNIK